MKFNCNAQFNKLRDWHKHFALLPVRVGDNDCRWLENVMRKGTRQPDFYGWYWEWEYKSMEEQQNTP